MHRSFAKPDSMIGFWTGYGSSGIGVQNAIWNAAVNNVLHPNVFWMYSFLDPDLTHSNSARDMGVAFRSLRFEGVGKLLMESERVGDGVANHYSMPSVHGASILGYHRNFDGGADVAPEKVAANFSADRDGWVRAVKDLGLQPDFVASEQVERGALANGKYRVLILPLSVALSADEAKAIEAFVRAGGVVIADEAAGMLNEHCAWQSKGMLNELFGISAPESSRRTLGRVAGSAEATAEGLRWGLKADALDGLTAVEPGVKAAGGQALAREGGIDWGRVTCFHLDEYVGLPESHPASFRKYLRERFAERVRPGTFHFIDGEAHDPREECRRLGGLITQSRIDVAFAGIGENGHLAFNDPPADFETDEPYIVVDLDDDCRRQQVGEGWFKGIDEVRRRAIRLHEGASLYLDRESASLLKSPDAGAI